MAQRVKNPPAVQETQKIQIQFLGREDPLEEAMVTHSSILTWKIQWTEEPGGCSPWGHKESDKTEGLRVSARTHTHTHTYTHTLRMQKGTLIHTCFPPLTQSCVFLPIMSIRFWLGHDCLCQRPKKIPLEPITGTSIFHTTLKGYIFIGSKEVCCPLGTVCHFRFVRLTCISLMENIMNGFDNP